MKLHELDWTEVLGRLRHWEALTPVGRRAFLQLRPGQKVPIGVLGDGGTELEAAGILVPPGARGTLHVLEPVLRPLLVALRAADRLRPLHGHGGVLKSAYLQDQLTGDQAFRIARPERGYHTPHDRQSAAEGASSVAWVRRFLAADTHERAIAWEARLLTGEDRPRLVFPPVAEALRALVEALAEHPAGRPLGEIGALLPAADPSARAAALGAALRYLLAFVSLDPETLDARLGLLPEVVRRLGPPPPPPAPQEPAERFHLAFRISDMTAVMVEAAAEPLPVRASDFSLFARTSAAIAARLPHCPPWVLWFLDGTPDEEHAETLEARVRSAVEALRALRLAHLRETSDRVRFAPTRKGQAWLARGEGERTRAVLDALRASPQRVPDRWSTAPGTLHFFGTSLGFSIDVKGIDLRGPLAEAFLSVPAETLVSVGGFMRHQAESRNPFLADEAVRLRERGGWGLPSTAEGWETAWARLLDGFLRTRLAPYGGAVLGLAGDGDLLFGLTPAGRYLLGAADDFTLPEVAADVVVQPDFEVVFLAPSPRAEAELGRFAERTGAGVGALFRITRASVLRAAEQGLAVEELLGTLAGVSRGGVPPNVERQVRDWMAGTRRVEMRPAVLVECPDAETAARVRGLGGAQVSEVTPTLLRFDADRKAQAAFVKKLRAKGIFVG